LTAEENAHSAREKKKETKCSRREKRDMREYGKKARGDGVCLFFLTLPLIADSICG
jgi:hypothetical protein